MMNKISIILFMLISFARFVIAAPGFTTSTFLDINTVSARAYGMGGAFSAIADDASAIWFNPAGLGLLKKQEIFITHAELLYDMRNEYAAYIFPFWEGAFGASFYLLTSKSFVPIVNYEKQDFSSMLNYSLMATVSYGMPFYFHTRLLVGLTLKFVRVQYGILADTNKNIQTNSFGGDFGFLYKILGHDPKSQHFLNVSTVFKNVMIPMKFSKDQKVWELPPIKVIAGVSYRFRKFFNVSIEGSFTFNEMVDSISAGIEAFPYFYISPRAGIKYSIVTRSLNVYAAVGTSFEIKKVRVEAYAGANPVNPLGLKKGTDIANNMVILGSARLIIIGKKDYEFKDEYIPTDTGEITLTLLNFENKSDNIYSDNLSYEITRVMTEQLAQTKEVGVLNRIKADKLMVEYNLSVKDLEEPAMAKWFGEQLGINAIIVGDYKKTGTEISISARLINIDTGLVQATSRVSGDAARGILKIVKELTGKIRDQIEEELKMKSTIDADLEDLEDLDDLLE